MASLFDFQNLQNQPTGQSGGGGLFEPGGLLGGLGAIQRQAFPQLQGGSQQRQVSGTTTGAPAAAGGTAAGTTQSPQSTEDLIRSLTPSGPSDDELSQIFSGAFQALEGQRQALEGQRPLAISQAEESGRLQKGSFEDLRERGETQFGRQERETGQEEGNAMRKARDLFNQLTQFNIARFGGSSSTGPAAQELLGRATQRNIGDVQSAATENKARISEARVELGNFVEKKFIEIDQSIKNKTAEIEQWFRNKINEIESNKAILESDKAGRKIEALRAREDFANQIRLAAAQQQLELNTWRQQNESAFAAQAASTEIPNLGPEGLLGVNLQAPQAGLSVSGATTPTRGGTLINQRFQQQPDGTFLDTATGKIVSAQEAQAASAGVGGGGGGTLSALGGALGGVARLTPPGQILSSNLQRAGQGGF